jgi:uncharacterized protein
MAPSSRRGLRDTERVPSNVDVIRPIYEQWGKGNWRYVPEVYADDMEWGWSDEFPGLSGVYRDSAVRNSRLREWLSPWEHWECEAEDYVTAGDNVVALCRYRGRGKGSGVVVDTEGAHVWKVRNGEVVRIEVFSSRERALREAGVEQ